MYVKIEPHNYNLIDLLFVLKSSSAYYICRDEEQFVNHRTAYNLLRIIEKDDKYSFVDLISDEIEFLSSEALKRPYDNNDILTLINVLTVYLSVVRYKSPLEEILSECQYLYVRQLKISDYDYSDRSESDEQEKDFFQELDESDDFDFGDNEEPPEIYERPSEVDEADIIRKPKSI